MSTQQAAVSSPVTVNTLRKMRREGEKIVCLTAYDASFATLVDQAGVDVILVGDSLGMVLQGRDTTVPVTMDDMVYHTTIVARGSRRPLLMADMPFMSFPSPEQALMNAARLMQEGLAHMVKLEGGDMQFSVVQCLTEHGIPVCAHIGLQPQSIHKLGGYRVQGRGEDAARIMLDDAKRLEDAGAAVLLLECVPTPLARKITESASVPVIGIGAGPDCDGQILVLYDMLGITPGKRLRFTKDFLEDAAHIPDALIEYVRAVKAGEFPGPEHSFD